MAKEFNWLVDLREVFIVFGVLLLIISYVEDNFDFFGYYFVFGVLVIILGLALYLAHFLENLE